MTKRPDERVPSFHAKMIDPETMDMWLKFEQPVSNETFEEIVRVVNRERRERYGC